MGVSTSYAQIWARRWIWLSSPPSKVLNFAAISTFAFALLAMATPAGPFPFPTHPDNIGGVEWGLDTVVTCIAAPVHLAAYAVIGLLSIVGLGVAFIGLPAYIIGQGENLGISGSPLALIFFSLPGALIFAISTVWLIKFVLHMWRRWRQKRTAVEGQKGDSQPRQRRRWLTVPLLATVLYLSWATQLPLRAAFALHQPQLERMADQASVSVEGVAAFDPARSVGGANVFAAYRLPLENDSEAWYSAEQAQYDQKAAEASVTALAAHTLWEHAGYVRDLSRQPSQITPSLFKFEPNSKMDYVQSLHYIGDGWYAYQNLIDS